MIDGFILVIISSIVLVDVDAFIIIISSNNIILSRIR
jgi:hypothetical protein